MQWLAVAGAIVGLLFLGLSLKHLAAGLSERIDENFWWCLAQALTIDASIVVSEAVLLVAAAKGIQRVRAWAMVWLLISLVTSSALNAQVYTQHQEFATWGWGWNAFLGVFSPLGVFFMAKMGTLMVLGQRKEVVIREGDEASLETIRLAGNLSRTGYRKREKKAVRL